MFLTVYIGIFDVEKSLSAESETCLCHIRNKCEEMYEKVSRRSS